MVIEHTQRGTTSQPPSKHKPTATELRSVESNPQAFASGDIGSCVRINSADSVVCRGMAEGERAGRSGGRSAWWGWRGGGGESERKREGE